MSRNLKGSENEMRMEFAKATPELPLVIIGKPTIQINPKDPLKPTEIISVVYAYDWIPGFDDTDLDSSREFCVDLRTESINGMTWSREDIEDISTAGYADSWGGDVDIWAMRGGWYNRNGTPVPHCRHQWVQLVIREQV